MGATVDSIPVTDIVGWDVRTWAKAVAYWESLLPDDGRVLRCLEIGAGPGGPSLWLAARGHEVICSNVANTRAQAGPLHERYEVETIRYEDIDARNIPYRDAFDVVIFKSVLGGAGATLDQQRHVIGQIHEALAPGGLLLFAENLRGAWLHRAVRALVYRLRRASWRFVAAHELRAMLAIFGDWELRSTGFLALLGVTEGHRRALAVVDDVIGAGVPASWRYVGYGSALKSRSAGASSIGNTARARLSP